MAREMSQGAAQQREIARDQQKADLGRTKGTGGELETRERVRAEEAFRGEQQKRKKHRERHRRVYESGKGEPNHHGRGTEDVGYVIDIEAEAGTLLSAEPRQGAIKAVAKPIQDDAKANEQQCLAVMPAKDVADARGTLPGKAEYREVVRVDDTRCAPGKPLQGPALQ